MATPIDWDSILVDNKPKGKSGGGQRGDGKKIEFVKFKAGVPKTVRPIGTGVQFVKFFMKTASGNRNVVVDLEHRAEAEAMVSAHAGREVKGSKKFAINVIDREDGKIRILEAGPQIFKPMAVWSKGMNNANIGGHEGADFQISPTGEGTDREYSASALRPTPFSPEEIRRAKELKELYSLSEVYKCCPLDKVVERLFGEKGDNGPDPSNESNPAPVMVAAGAEAIDDPSSW